MLKAAIGIIAALIGAVTPFGTARAAVTFLGGEFRVNQTTSGAQATERGRTVARSTDGTFVVVWRDDSGPDGSGSTIMARRYAADGTPLTGEFVVNTTTVGDQRRPDVAMGIDGRFVIVWHGPGIASIDSYGRLYDGSGVPLGTEFRVNTYTTSSQFRPVAAMADDGSFVVAWTSNGQDGDNDGMFGQRYDASAVAVGSEFQINTFTTSVQEFGAISMNSAGEFVVTWQGLSEDGSSWGVFGQRFDGAGAPLGTEFQANVYTAGLQAGADVTMLEPGGFVVAWDSAHQDGSSYGIFGRRFDGVGTPVGTEFRINTSTSSFQRNPSLTSNDDGSFAAAWHSDGTDGSATGIFVQRYDASGNPAGGEFQVNTHTIARQYYGDIASDGSGEYVVTWESDGQDGSSWGVYAQRFAAPTCGNHVVEAGEECDDGNLVDGDGCDSSCTQTGCGNHIVTAGEACDDGVETPTCDDDCTLVVCGDGNTNEAAGEQCDDTNLVDGDGCDTNCTPTACGNAIVTSGEDCDDGGESTDCDDDCTLVVCGDGNRNTTAGEECDPPAAGICSSSCVIEFVCGDGILSPLEECEDGNVDPGDGCDGNCRIENKFCLLGRDPVLARKAAVVAFASASDYVGTNADRNDEIFVFQKKAFDKLRKRGVAEQTALDQTITQITFTEAPTVNKLATLSGSGRFLAFVSDGDPIGQNVDENEEIFLYDIKSLLKNGTPPTITQVTDTDGVASSNPSLRSLKGDLVLFDSIGNLAPSHCVGDVGPLPTCESDLDCPGSSCGNVDGSREVFQWSRRRPDFGILLRQITTATAGMSEIGHSVDFDGRVTAFASTSDLFGGNPGGNSEIYRVAKNGTLFAQITDVPAGQGESKDPSQARKRRVAFTSSADLDPNHPVGNADGNDEIFLWREELTPVFKQLTNTANCTNAKPAIDDIGRFVAFDSDCDIVGPNPGRSIFVYDDQRAVFLQVGIRGPLETDAATALMTKRARVIAFSGNVDSALAPAICFFDTKKKQLEGPGLP